MVLDEATGGLDPVVRDEILDKFNDFTRAEDYSILIFSHIISNLEKICDYIAFLHKGRLLFCEEKDRLKETYGMLHVTEEEFKELPIDAVAGSGRVKQSGIYSDNRKNVRKEAQMIKLFSQPVAEV